MNIGFGIYKGIQLEESLKSEPRITKLPILLILRRTNVTRKSLRVEGKSMPDLWMHKRAYFVNHVELW